MSGSHVDPNESIDLEEVSALAHQYAADSPDKRKKDNNDTDNSNNANNNAAFRRRDCFGDRCWGNCNNDQRKAPMMRD